MRKTILAAMAASAMMAPGLARADFINILTGGTSGVYYPMGVGMSKLFGEKITGARPSVQATKASVENLNLLQQGKGEIAFTLGDSVISAWKGEVDAGFPAPLKKLRGIAAIYPNYIQIVASKESGIKTLADLKGKRLSVGAPKSGTELNARAILSAAGLSYKDLGKVEYLPFGDSVELMKNRQLDATLQSAGLGVASIRDLSTSVEIVMVEVPPTLIDKAGPPFIQGAIPPNTYTGQTTPISTAAVMNYLVTHEGMSEKAVYEMTKAIFENLPTIAAAHAAGRSIKVENAMDGMAIPVHPGAAKYFAEKGIKVPATN
ncbi:MAG: TAXI family TRAP transporter solute-binding subunit [Beijerinckiaceae bacterium]|nr:TAXI family TRAP transporter solute-binding subunit [Beijerinckiaceae bacterium]